MKIIGITGPTGAGKTTALNVLRDLGAEVLDADAVYHRLLEESLPLRQSLAAAFGVDILDASGRVDRRRLSAAVYPDRLEELQSALSFKPQSSGAVYSVQGGTTIREGRETLNITSDGTVTYHAPDQGSSRYTVGEAGETPSDTQIIEAARKLAAAAGISVPASFLLEQGFHERDALNKARSLGFPLFVKPLRAGSSFGISRVTEPGAFTDAVYAALLYDTQVLVEKEVPGFEVGCAVMGRHTLMTGEPDEIELSGGFFDFQEKYGLISSKIHVPARVSREKADQIKESAKKIYRALGCAGFARVDMFLTPAGEIIFNEVNTIPGFTPHSRFPAMMGAAGISFTQLIDLAIKEAEAE